MNGKKLYRSRTDRKISGVCGGLAVYFDLDPALVRVGMFLLALPGGPSILLYFVLWVVIPEEPGPTSS
ncbi:MAG: PspC domain-containing protein [Candidatus Saccharimonadales bacterium]|jgi:phage shock protein C